MSNFKKERHIKSSGPILALNSAVNAKVLDLQKVKEIAEELRENFFQMQTEFNLSPTLKLHILFDHYVEHEMTGESL